MNLSSSIATSSSTASSPIASKTNSFDAASTSQVRLQDAYLGGLMDKQRGNPSHQEEEDSEDSDNPEAEIWYYQGQNSKAWEQPLAHGVSSSVDKDSQKDIAATTHIPLCGSHLLDGQGNLWKTTWRSCERFGRGFGHLEHVHEYHSSSSGSLGNSGTVFQGNRKAGQWSDRNRWHKLD